MGGGLSKYIETGTAGQHQSGGPCCGDYCPLWEVGEGGGGGGDGEEEELLETDIDQQALTCNPFVCSLLAAPTFYDYIHDKSDICIRKGGRVDHL